MAEDDLDLDGYQSPIGAGFRFVTQHLLLKQAINRVVKVQVHGLAHLDAVEGAFIAAANHSSHLDAPLIISYLPRRLSKYMATGAAADYFFDNPIKAAPVKAFFNAFPVERKGMRARKGIAGQLLSEGIPLLIFPEGTRSRTGALGRFTTGAAALCISRNVPFLPIALVGAFAAWPYGQNHLPRNRPEVHVVFGHPLHAAPGEIAHQFAERLRRNVQQLHDSTARAYGLPTLDDYARAAQLRARSSVALSALSPSEPEPSPATTVPPKDAAPAAPDTKSEPGPDRHKESA